MKRKILFIINPVSGVNGQKRLAETIHNEIDQTQFDIEVVYTTAPLHATRLAAEAAANKLFAAVAVGGDGTVHETAGGLIDTQTALGIIPTGSGNGLARHLGIPMKVDAAVRHINTCTVKPIDTITVNDKYFVNMMGLGFDAHIAREFAVQGTRGLATYAKVTLAEFMAFDEQPFEIIYKNGESKKINAFMLSIANSTQYGNNAHIAPSALTDDGKFELCVVQKVPFWDVAAFCVRLFTKRADKSRYVSISSAEECVVKNPNKNPMHLDGEPFDGEAELYLRVKPLSLPTLS